MKKLVIIIPLIFVQEFFGLTARDLMNAAVSAYLEASDPAEKKRFKEIAEVSYWSLSDADKSKALVKAAIGKASHGITLERPAGVVGQSSDLIKAEIELIQKSKSNEDKAKHGAAAFKKLADVAHGVVQELNRLEGGAGNNARTDFIKILNRPALYP